MFITHLFRFFPQVYKSFFLVLSDLLLFISSFFLACYLGTGDLYSIVNILPLNYFFFLVLIMFLFYMFGVYGEIIRYISLSSVIKISIIICCSSLILLANAELVYFENIPLRVYFINLLLSIVFIVTSRLLARYFVNDYVGTVQRITTKERKKHVAIYGAGSTGVQLARYIGGCSEYLHVVFFDEDNRLSNRKISGIKIILPNNIRLLCKQYSIDEVYLAIPCANAVKRKTIIESFLKCSVRVKTIPSFSDLVSGIAKVEELSDIAVEELLGRTPVQPKESLLKKCISEKSVLVTGAGGSIGAELCRQIVLLNPIKLVLFELSEYALYKVETELLDFINENGLKIELIGLLGSVQHKKRMLYINMHYGIDTVYHAAAYKHVPIVEDNPIEGVRNNVFGTLNAAMAADESGVKTFVLVSTDKAVRPTNVMGATKRLAELVLQGISQTETTTKFCMVRFGNVLNSSGSVVPLFRKQIDNKGPVTVTHPDVTRYFMSIPEAAQLVLQAGTLAKGGDVCVLDMGEPVKIIDLARKMIALSGLNEKTDEIDGDIAIDIIGLRPGEKLTEELLIGSNVVETKHPLIMRAVESNLSWDTLQKKIAELDVFCHSADANNVTNTLWSLVTCSN